MGPIGADGGKMKIKFVCVSDSHTQFPRDLPDGDILIHAGDWSNAGSIQDLERFSNWLNTVKAKYKHMIVIAGNHDWCAQRHHELTQESIEAAGGIYLNDSGVVVDNIKVWGSPVQPTFFNWAFNKDRGDKIQQHWDLIPQDTQVLITHGPPFGIGDKLSKRGSDPGQHVGCQNLLNTIENKLSNLKLHVFGHIHEGQGVYEKNDVMYVNASILDERYRQTNHPTCVEIEF